MVNPVIEFEGVSFRYDERPVLENVSFSVAENECICVIGPNGGGKSTLVKLILGLLAPDSGSVRVFGKKPEEAVHQVGYMPQHLHYDPQFPMRVIDVVLMGRLDHRKWGWFRKQDREAAMHALEQVDLLDRADSRFSGLSGGQRQRVLIARALTCSPDLLLLDEPTANVDRGVESRFYDILQTLSKRMAIVMVSHDLGFVLKMVDKVFCVHHEGLHIHRSEALTGEMVQQLFNADVRIVRHDACEREDHRHD